MQTTAQMSFLNPKGPFGPRVSNESAAIYGEMIPNVKYRTANVCNKFGRSKCCMLQWRKTQSTTSNNRQIRTCFEHDLVGFAAGQSLQSLTQNVVSSSPANGSQDFNFDSSSVQGSFFDTMWMITCIFVRAEEHCFHHFNKISLMHAQGSILIWFYAVPCSLQF